MKVALIPARGGSKRIPRKNIKTFCGKPMIAWSIEAAFASGCFDRVIVSTDDAEIASIARDCHAEVPFMRKRSLSDDHTTTTAVVIDFIEWFQTNESQSLEWVCCLYATAPFVQADVLRRGLELVTKSDADYLFPVTNYSFPIQRAVRINQAGRVEMFEPKHFNTRSQDLEEAYHDAGQFYWGRTSAWLRSQVIFGPNSIPMPLPRSMVQDIDTEEDWNIAEMMFRATALNKV